MPKVSPFEPWAVAPVRFEPIDPPWPALREWIPADDTDPQAVFPEESVSTHWFPKEIRLDDDRTLVLAPC